MSRYIDADALHEKYDKYANHSSIGRGNGKTLARFLDWLDDQPTADVVEVVHGKWIPNESDRHHHCSVCMEDALCKEDWQFLDCVEILSEYCPNCGSKMERREDEQIH